MQNRQIILKSRPVGRPTADNFELKEIEIPTPAEGELLLKALYISVDPYMRGRMSDAKSYVEPFQVGEPINGGAVAEVTESRHPDFSAGDVVVSRPLAWQEYQTVPATSVQKVDKDSVPLSYYLGILGMTGLTAYFGLLDIGQPKKGETVVVSGAAGAVGTAVGQIAKIHGCRVVGIAGSEEKLRYLKDELHFDEVINYRTEKDMEQAIARTSPDGVDIYFDNVGGEISDAVMANINKFARISICGQISLYNATSVPTGPRIQTTILKKSALMKGFIISDYAERLPEGMAKLVEWVKEGKLKNRETVIKGFEKLPEAFIGLFDGVNTGKLVVETK
ncbi:putative NADP-dependent oxidoreductase YfmJ [Prolixibacter bellariivorans]|uniref:Putative NADP-dependent oxidoreductase YfmJ n=1 Tax=Prolixibacter bellariivorans TaxID=314319 RepID=A0A5M4AWS0_9BACT|nr:NADP-dependent oxidoreductase [Prolixibacter bellariivorans]GET32214.1 putative NADP-dependent oxidoreductase YfmJ [Prolixibacter bellariivorans]